MSGDKQPANVMFHHALVIMGMLADVVERIEIAGSLRRDQQWVGDIELVMAVRDGEAFERRCGEMLERGVMSKRLNTRGTSIGWGQRFKAGVFRGAPVDMFIVLADRQWGPTMVLRTGPASANGVLVTTRGVRNRDGLVGVLPSGLAWREGAIWRGDVRIDTPEEIDVFAACGLPYLAPYERDAGEYQFWARRRAGDGRSILAGTWCELKWRVGGTWKAAPVIAPMVFEKQMRFR